MEKKKHMLIPACHLVLISEGKILLQRRLNTGYEDGNYSMVAGHVEKNETFFVAMIREAKEEAGLIIANSDLIVAHVMQRKKGSEERIDFFIIANKWTGEPRIEEPDKCDDLRWFSLENLPINTIPYIRYAIENIKKNVFCSEFGYEQ